MKIIRNLPAAVKLLRVVRYFNKNMKKIDDAKAAGDFVEERKWILDSTSTFGPMIMEEFGCNLHIQGEENIPDEGPVVIISNHQSYTDIPVLMAVFRKFQFGFIAKQYLAKAPLLGSWMPRIRSVFIENDNPRAALDAIYRGVEYINEGFSMAIFPEGTRSKGSEVGTFMRGALKLATKPGVPIIPVSINGTYKTFEETGVARGARIDVIVHPKMETAGITRAEEKLLPDKLEGIIKEGVREIVSAN
ncbi:MAG: lysophospholipid acyltransferase family protein [Bacillota bacterium]|nr:lysophospholipid acyltransferase family protein [Bacillota bacterium]